MTNFLDYNFFSSKIRGIAPFPLSSLGSNLTFRSSVSGYVMVNVPSQILEVACDNYQGVFVLKTTFTKHTSCLNFFLSV